MDVTRNRQVRTLATVRGRVIDVACGTLRACGGAYATADVTTLCVVTLLVVGAQTNVEGTLVQVYVTQEHDSTNNTFYITQEHGSTSNTFYITHEHDLTHST